ncbi:hypothetical protein QYF61_009835 [Mycteria americana]|uniref:Ig-like domain-containing protein n=1 Tax=Mycteria americana TaxID=33587 RepID=A0AAN7RLB5_MYCAM|nr:hypothetical protein QYF61_009835 [Mycteria americana]
MSPALFLFPHLSAGFREKDVVLPLVHGHRNAPTSVALTFAESWSDNGLFFLSAAVTGQVALEQHIGELAVREGDGVTFQCSMSGDSMSSYYMFWYRQRPRGTLDWIYREGDAYGEGFQDRFKGTVESSQNRFTLQIQAAKQGDEAVYYCGAGLTLEQLCSRVDQKPTAREYRLLSVSFQQTLTRGWCHTMAGAGNRPLACLQYEAVKGSVVEGLRPFMLQVDLLWELERLYGEVQVIARCLGSCPAWPSSSSVAWL